RLARELLEEPFTKRFPSMVRVPFSPGRQADDSSGSRGYCGLGGRGCRLPGRLGDKASLAPHRGCFGGGCDGHLPALFLGLERVVRSWGSVRCSGAIPAVSLGDLALDSDRTWGVGFPGRITGTSWLSGHPFPAHFKRLDWVRHRLVRLTWYRVACPHARSRICSAEVRLAR